MLLYDFFVLSFIFVMKMPLVVGEDFMKSISFLG